MARQDSLISPEQNGAAKQNCPHPADNFCMRQSLRFLTPAPESGSNAALHCRRICENFWIGSRPATKLISCWRANTYKAAAVYSKLTLRSQATYTFES